MSQMHAPILFYVVKLLSLTSVVLNEHPDLGNVSDERKYV